MIRRRRRPVRASRPGRSRCRARGRGRGEGTSRGAAVVLAAVVLDPEHEVVGAPLKVNVDPGPGTHVLHGVRRRLLHDVVGRQLDRRAERKGGSRLRQHDRDARRPDPFQQHGQLRERGLRARDSRAVRRWPGGVGGGVGVGIPQDTDDATHVLQGVPPGVGDRDEHVVGARRRCRREGRARLGQPDDDGQGVCDDVVHVPGDPGPFGEDRRPGGLGAGGGLQPGAGDPRRPEAPGRQDGDHEGEQDIGLVLHSGERAGHRLADPHHRQPGADDGGQQGQDAHPAVRLDGDRVQGGQEEQARRQEHQGKRPHITGRRRQGEAAVGSRDQDQHGQAGEAVPGDGGGPPQRRRQVHGGEGRHDGDRPPAVGPQPEQQGQGLGEKEACQQRRDQGVRGPGVSLELFDGGAGDSGHAHRDRTDAHSREHRAVSSLGSYHGRTGVPPADDGDPGYAASGWRRRRAARTRRAADRGWSGSCTDVSGSCGSLWESCISW